MGSGESKQAAARLPYASLVALPSHLTIRRDGLQYFLSDASSRPLCLIRKTGEMGPLVLYAGPTRTADPVAVVSQSSSGGGLLGRDDAIVSLAGHPPSDHALHKRWRGILRAPCYAFEFPTGGMGGTERFEWRSSRGEEVRGLGEQTRGWKLLRLRQQNTQQVGVGDGDGDGEGEGEVVAVWAGADPFSTMHRSARFALAGSGGELGEAWRAMAVVSFVRVWQMISGEHQRHNRMAHRRH